MFNLFKKRESPPEWFTSNAEDYNYFIEIVERVKKEKLPEYSFSPDKSALVFVQEQKESLRFNLFNIAQTCIQSSKSEWENIVISFIDSLLQSSEDESFVDFEKIKSTIVFQIYPKEILEQTEIPFLHKEIVPETIAILAFDLPKKIQFIKPETVELWKKEHDELFDLALKNTKEILNKLEFESIGDNSSVYVCESEDALTACGALFLNTISKQYNENGIIFSIPNRHNIFTLEITNLDAVTKELPFFCDFTQKVFLDSPYGVNSNIYWFKNGVYTRLSYEITDSNFNFYPTQEFLNLFE